MVFVIDLNGSSVESCDWLSHPLWNHLSSNKVMPFLVPPIFHSWHSGLVVKNKCYFDLTGIEEPMFEHPKAAPTESWRTYPECERLLLQLHIIWSPQPGLHTRLYPLVSAMHVTKKCCQSQILSLRPSFMHLLHPHLPSPAPRDHLQTPILTYKALPDLAQQYTSDLLPQDTLSQDVQSSDLGLLCISHTSLLTFGDRAFSVAAPTLMELTSKDS